MTDTENNTNKGDAIAEIVNNAQKPIESLQDAVMRLSLLSPLEYETVREDIAKKHNIKRVSVLDKEVEKYRKSKEILHGEGGRFPHIEPWPESLERVQLMNDIRALVKHYIVCNNETAIATTLWIVFTWFIDQVQVAPIAMITAPEKRCGKSQLLTLIGKLASRPVSASNISPAAIFRFIEAHKPTLLIDEADSFLSENEEARGILNSGHTRSTAHVIRVVGDDHDVKQFSTWGAKAICGIGRQADTLMDRSVILELRRKLPNEKVQRLRHAEPLQFDIFKRQLARMVLDAGDAIAKARPSLPETLNDRAQDNWEPLLAIADYVGGEWPDIARQASLKIAGKEEDSPSLSAELLVDIKEVFDENRILKVKSRDLIDHLCEDDMKPWITYNRGKPITPRQVAKRLSEYGIEPKTIRFSGTAKGYERSQFEDAFDRYIPLTAPNPSLSVTPSQTNATNDYRGFKGVTENNSVTDKNTLKAPKNSHCYGVTDKRGVCGEEHNNEEVF
jgi:putative DNA primase/helicase